MVKKNKPQYNNIFVDFDGVISNSNELKKQNILKAATTYLSVSQTKDFVSYFTSNNGIPREKKIYSYIKDVKIADKILIDYNKLNVSLLNAPLINGVEEFLKKNTQTKIIVLSGGDLEEISKYLAFHLIDIFFTDILCGPKTKEDNIKNYNLSYPALFIGDSLHDYEIAQKFNFDFVFMFGATQEAEWQNHIFKNTLFIKDFINFELLWEK